MTETQEETTAPEPDEEPDEDEQEEPDEDEQNERVVTEAVPEE